MYWCPFKYTGRVRLLARPSPEPSTAVRDYSQSQVQMTFFLQISHRFSDCVEVMYVDPIRAVVEVAFNKGNVYRFTHVSRRAIVNLLLQPSMSLGFWVNRNLLPYDCKSQVFGETTVLPVDSLS